MNLKRYSISHILLGILNRTAFLFPDKLFVRLKYRLSMGYWPDLKQPKTFNEKLQWLKLYNRKPEYTRMVDKYAVKEYVAHLIGEEYIIPTIGVWDSFDEIDFGQLPNQFVLKTTHGGGGNGVVICTDKSTFDYQRAKEKLEHSLATNMYRCNREWPYKHVRRRIIAEQYMVDESGLELKDYKFFCFNGQAHYCKVDFDRFIEHRANYYDMDWQVQEFGEVVCPPRLSHHNERPEKFEQMVQIANRLSQDIPFVRIDLYNIHGRIYFGEITFFPASGFGPFTIPEWDTTWGNLLHINL